MTRPLATLFAFSSALLGACASAPAKPPTPPPAPAATQPAPDRLARLAPFDRSALLVEGELVRLAAIPPDPAAASAGRRGAPADTVPMIVAIQDAGGAPTYGYVGPASGYRGGLLSRVPGAFEALERARQASPFHRAVAAKVGPSEASCSLDRFPRAAGANPEYRLTLLVREGAPSAPAEQGSGEAKRQEMARKMVASAPGPTLLELFPEVSPDGRVRGALGAVFEATSARGARVRAVSAGGPAERAGLRPGDVIVGIDRQLVASGEELTRLVTERAPYAAVTLAVERAGTRLEVPATPGQRATSAARLRRPGAILTVGDAWLEPDGRLGAISFPPWRPPPDFFLQGRTSRDLWPELDRATEQAINDAVVEWKTRELPGWLRQASGEELEASIITTEKGILTLDVIVRTVKDRIDAAARNKEVAAFPGAGEIEQLLEQRKMLLGVVLQATKGAAAQKVR
jgi:hypothetical protein